MKSSSQILSFFKILSEIEKQRKMIDVTKTEIGNIQRIHFDKFEKDFSFIVNGKIYQTNSFVANIVSPKISLMLEKNLNQSFYEINTEYEGNFNKIIEYGEMKPINLNQNEIKYFCNILKLLGNNFDIHQFYDKFQDDISYENVVQRICKKKEFEMDLNEEIIFISNNFHAFITKYPEAMFELDVDIIEQIISNDALKINNEEELFDFVLSLYIKSKEYSTLFSHVIFINLPSKSIYNFNQNFDINDMNKSIWEKISYRLQQDISIKSIEEYKKSYQEFLNNRYIDRLVGKRYEHIFKHLSENYQRNLQNILNVTSSSVLNDDCKVAEIVESNQKNESDFETKDEMNSWIAIDFKDRKVLFDHYTLTTIDCPQNFAHLKSWLLEVSNDGKNYMEIDRHENTNILNGPRNKQTFKVSCSTPQRFVRLRQIGPNWRGCNKLVLNQIEFSGLLYE